MLNANEFFGGACYHNKQTREWISATLILKSIKLFYHNDIIIRSKPLYKIFKTYKDSVELLSKNSVLLNKIVKPLFDNIAIITAFENYFKASLLLKGYLIHQIDNNRSKGLFNEQKRRPLLISDLKRQEGLLYRKKINIHLNY